MRLYLENKVRNNNFAASLLIQLTSVIYQELELIKKKTRCERRDCVVLLFGFGFVCSIVLRLSLISSAIQLLPVGGSEMLIFNL